MDGQIGEPALSRKIYDQAFGKKKRGYQAGCRRKSVKAIIDLMNKPSLHTVLSPALLHLYDVTNTVVVVIDVLRATSTIATALYNGALEVIPVDSVERCIQLGKELTCITAGERDGQIAPGLQYGNSSFEYPREFVQGKILV